MISANGGLPAHRYTPQVTPRWPRGSQPASRGMKQAALLISGITPEDILDIAHEASIFGGSPLSRSGSMVPPAMAPRASSSRAVGV